MTQAAKRDAVGFIFQTPTSINVPGRWGFLPLMWPPAALIADVAEYPIFAEKVSEGVKR